MSVDLHPVKKETFNTTEHINVDPKGYLREVDSYKVTDFGLYMARGANHPRFGYLESWLLPKLSLRANIFHFREGIDERQDFTSILRRLTAMVKSGLLATFTWI